MLTFSKFIFECFRSSESYFFYIIILLFLHFWSSEWLFFWEIVQSISLFLKFLGQNFHVTPSELFTNPLYQNQYDFVEVKTLEAGENIPQQPFVFLEIDNKTFLMQSLTVLSDFDLNWIMNLIDTFINTRQSQENVYTHITT